MDDLKARLRARAAEMKEVDTLAHLSLYEAADRIEKLEAALDPFSRVAVIAEPVAQDWPDDKPAKDILPGVWPTWGDLKRARATLSDNGGV